MAALRDVSDVLSSRERLAEMREQRVREVTALETTVKLSFERYVASKAKYYEVLETQQQLFPRNSISRAPSTINSWPPSRFTVLGGG
jgi:multidrug efflux system outer membrane protein